MHLFIIPQDNMKLNGETPTGIGVLGTIEPIPLFTENPHALGCIGWKYNLQKCVSAKKNVMLT